MSDLSAKVPLTFERRVSSGGGGVFLLVIGGGSIAVMLIAVLSDSYFYRDPVWRGWFMAGLVLVIGGAICLHFYPFREWTEKVVVGGGWVRRYKRDYKQNGPLDILLFEAPYDAFRKVVVKREFQAVDEDCGFYYPNVFLFYTRETGTAKIQLFKGKELTGPASSILNRRDKEMVRRISGEIKIPIEWDQELDGE